MLDHLVGLAGIEQGGRVAKSGRSAGRRQQGNTQCFCRFSLISGAGLLILLKLYVPLIGRHVL